MALSIALFSSAALVGCGGSSSNDNQDTLPGDGNDGGGVDVAGQFITDTGYVEGVSTYTGLTFANGVVYASRVDARNVGVLRAGSAAEPMYDSVILRAAEGSDEFEVVQQLDGKRVGGIDAITVVTGDEVDGVRPKDELVIACYPAENRFDPADAPEIVGLVAYRDDDLADTDVLVGEELSAPGSSEAEFAQIAFRDFVQGQGVVLRQALTDCNDVSVAVSEEVNGSNETEYTVVVSGAGIDTTQSDPSNPNIQRRSQAYFEPGLVYSWSRNASNSTSRARNRDLIFDGPSTQSDGRDQFLVDSVELAVLDGPAPLVVIRDPNETDNKFGRTNVGADQAIVKQDDNVFTGVDPDEMQISSLQQLPGTTRFFAAHDVSDTNAKGLATFDVTDVSGSGDGLTTLTRFESLGQVGMDCLGELTFVSDTEGLCMSGTTPGQFIFFNVPAEPAEEPSPTPAPDEPPAVAV